jgi:hypothetical protein
MISPSSLYVGQNGFFGFYSPFDSSYHLEDLLLTIDHISAINTLVLDNVDIESNYFKYYKLSKDQYTSFLNNNGVIVTFKAPNGDRYGVPSTFIKSIPDLTQVPYRQLGINVVLGPLPVDYDLDALKNQIQKAVIGVLGVQASINFSPLSPIILMNQPSTPNVPQYYDPVHVSLDSTELMISAVQSLGKYLLNSPSESSLPSTIGNLVQE